VPWRRIRYRQRTVKSLAHHPERHNTHRIGWLRAAVLGANDGVLSTSSLVIGIAASNVTHGAILVSGVAGLVAGSMSIAAGEYVSVSSQSDTEKADTDVERRELAEDEGGEHAEPAAIYRRRRLGAGLAKEVAAAAHRYRSSPGDLLGSSRDDCDGGSRRAFRRNDLTAPAKSERSRLQPSAPPSAAAALCALAGSLLITAVDTNTARRHPLSAPRITAREAPA